MIVIFDTRMEGHFLLLGEADFTFSLALLRGLMRASATDPSTTMWHIVATCFDQEEKAMTKYRDLAHTVEMYPLFDCAMLCCQVHLCLQSLALPNQQR